MSKPSAVAETKKQVIVLGAGVIGLTTALRLQESNDYQVEVLAELFPTDLKNINYTSQWAGAHHVSTQERTPDVEWLTFQEMWKLSEPGSLAEHCFMRIKEHEYFDSPVLQTEVMARMPNFQKLPQSDLPIGAEDGYSFDALTIDVPVYLNFLLSRLLEKGGTIVRGRVQHISQVLEAGTYPFKDHSRLVGRNEPIVPPHAVFVCLGLGARFLGGLEDHDMYPARGQTVILRAPWIKSGMAFHGDGANRWAYVIPRRSGDVIVGGTMGINDWYPKARPETTHEILEYALLYCPELVPLDFRETERLPLVDDLKSIIVEEACGLRPMRKGGPRIELDYLNTRGRQVPVIFNYGHGPYGYMASIGSANMCLKLLKEAGF
ncbi:D-amino-acid oxidase [Crepidotus variabilis]|uniref:D-amino-acid oxidase n=1 Tax=Crepidotus variabilis TaxID=179855 RepID=A0A9P6EET1_9AGAR|nr:D-amino-acid oxidase [Crepidotus variabilis]